jgi:hydrogenase maturation factor
MSERPDHAEGAAFPEVGKVTGGILNEVILKRLGRRRSEVLVGPKHGVDVGVIDLGDGRVMAVTTDPFFIVPAYGWERSAWFAVHILLSDAATSGLAPDYLTIDLNLPLSMGREPLERMWTTVHEECERLGVAVVTGHTGRYDGCAYPMVGGATAICIGPKDAYVTPEMARSGDAVIITKGPAIEASGLFAVTFPGRVAARYGDRFAEEAQSLFRQMTVVEDAMTAVSVGVRDEGVTAMHDATEGGVWRGLVEVAEASGVGLHVDQDSIVIQEPVARICDLFEIDPMISISEGTLIMSCRPHRADAVLEKLQARGIPATIVGEILPPERGIRRKANGIDRELHAPEVDPFWRAYAKALEEGDAEPER